MNYSLALIAAVLETRDFARAIKAGADREGLLSGEAQVYWDALKDHYENFHEVPSLQMFSDTCPTYRHAPSEDTMEAVVHELKTIRLGSEIDGALCQISELNGADPWEAKNILIRLTENISARNSKNNHSFVVGADKEETLRQIELLQSGHGLLGYPWPWEHFNENSVGVCNGNAFYIYGRHKSRKTFLLLYMALHYWNIGLKVLFFTREMSYDELKWRIYAVACGLSYLDVIKASFTPEGKQAIEDVMDALAESNRFIISDIADGISGFKAEIEEHHPQIVFHDYFKAMADDQMGTKINGEHRYVARTVDMMKSYISDKAKIPLIFAGHANREGSKTKGSSDTEHAWSDHIARRVDGAFRVVTDGRNGRMALFVNAGRSMREGLGLTLDATLCETFGQALDSDYGWIKGFSEAQDEEDSSRDRAESSRPSRQPAGSTRFSASSFRKPMRRR
jgi:hypothetical protein